MSIAVGVIGAGVMGSDHARILQTETIGAHLAAVCDADADRAGTLGAPVVSDPLALINSDRIDAVVVASPDATHADLVQACLRAGKPVLCEKPLASSVDEAQRIIDAETHLGKRLVQVGYMRRFDPAYQEMQAVSASGAIGRAVLLHNSHRNAKAPDWFTGPMAITNSFVHEIDISRWLLGSEITSAQIVSGSQGDPLMITMLTDRDAIVSTEVFMNAAYGYHVHAELVGQSGSVVMQQPVQTQLNRALQHGHAWPENWIPRFRTAYVRQMNAWIRSISTGVAAGASAWDGFVASAIAEKLAPEVSSGRRVSFDFGQRPAIYT